MHILLVGVLDVEWSTNCSMKRALEDQGHKVTDFNYRTVASSYNPGNLFSGSLADRLIDKGTSVFRSSRSPLPLHWFYTRNGRREMNRALLDTVSEGSFDLVLLSKTDTVDYRSIPEINKYAPTWYFFMDPMEQALRINARAYAACSTWASATFSDVNEHFIEAGADSYWITQGVDSEVFYPEETPKEFDVVFVGTKTRERVQYVSNLRNAGFSVSCFGEGWENAPVYQEELVGIYRRSRIVLNFCRKGRGFSIRVFQVMGAGAFMLSGYCPDLEAFFKREEHLDWFSGPDEMVRKSVEYLDEKEKRERIAENGCLLVHNKYSWKAVMKKIIEVSSEAKEKRAV